MSSNLFQFGDVVLHSGERRNWKIDCDALTDADIACLARLLHPLLPSFGAVEGVPRGGLRLASELQRYETTGPLLIVDDVFTTGRSIKAHREGRFAIGAVIFARSDPPAWIVPLFRTYE